MKAKLLYLSISLFFIVLVSACAGGTDSGLVDGDFEDQTDGDMDDDGIVMKKQTLHFRITTNGWLDEDEDYVLHVAGKRHVLSKHTEESKANYADLFASMDEKDHPSHYLADIDLPDHKATRIHITQRTDKKGAIKNAHGESLDHGLSLMFIHVPYDSAKKYSSKMRAKKRFKDNTGDLTEDEVYTYGPYDIAYSLVFHHPELMNIDPDNAANIMYNHIYQAAGIDALAQAIQEAGNYGWYDMVPITDSDDQPVYNSRGEQMYNYQVKEDILNAAREAVINSLNSTKNDATLAGECYHVTEGVAHIENSGVTSKTSDYKFKLAKTGFQHGYKTSISYDDDEVTVNMRNDYVRHLSVFAKFYDENDNPVQPDAWSSFFENWLDFTGNTTVETDTSKFLSMVNPVPTIMGIPVAGDFNNSQVTFDWPMNARYAEIRAGGLGHGGTKDNNEVAIGATMTGIFELAIPTIVLAATAGISTEASLLEDVADDLSLSGTIVSTFFGLMWSHSETNYSHIAKQLAVAAAEFIWTSKAIRKWLMEKIAESEAEEAVPFVGLALHIADMAATASALAQSSAEVGTSPWIIMNRIYPTHNIEVIIDHDVDDYQFPATATHYKVIAKFSSSDTQVINKTLPVDPETGDPVTVSDPQTVTFVDVPAGGHFDLKVLFYSDTGWIAGQKDVNHIENVNDEDSDKLTVTLAIEENLVPLSSDTYYHHKVILNYDETDGYYWHGDHNPPTDTYLDYSVATDTNAISYLGNITVSQKIGAAAYTWKGYTPGQDACADNAGGGHLYNFKSVSLTEHPEVNMMQTDCGYSTKPYIQYDFMGDEDNAKNWVVIAKNNEFYVRKIGYHADGSFHIPTTTYGKFPIRVDSMLYHPQGYLIAINNEYSKMYSLELPDEAVEDDAAPEAIPIAGPALYIDSIEANPSLLRHPIAIKLAADNAVVILDDIHELTQGTDDKEIKARVKVFTNTGTPIKYFNNKQDFHLNLVEQDTNKQVTFLDFDVESQGYIYVLSYATPTDQPNYQVTAEDYRLDIYDPQGTFVSRTSGIAAAKMALDKWRNVYSLNYQMLVGANDYTEPTVSEWIPSTPEVDGDSDSE